MERELNRCGISGDVNVPENPSEDRAEPEGKASFNMCYINKCWFDFDLILIYQSIYSWTLTYEAASLPLAVLSLKDRHPEEAWSSCSFTSGGDSWGSLNIWIGCLLHLDLISICCHPKQTLYEQNSFNEVIFYKAHDINPVLLNNPAPCSTCGKTYVKSLSNDEILK